MAVNGASFKLSENELRVMNIDHILTKKQISEKEKCLAKGQGMTLTLSIAQMKKLVKEKKHVGGFIFTIPAILAAIGAIGSVAGGAAAIAKTVSDVHKNKSELEEMKRHNLAMEKKGTGIKKSKNSKAKN